MKPRQLDSSSARKSAMLKRLLQVALHDSSAMAAATLVLVANVRSADKLIVR